MRAFFFVILVLANWPAAQAQVLLPTAETAFAQQHNFNSAFIREKGIKRITYEILDKKDFEAPVDKNMTEVYEFDDKGRLTRHYYTTVVRTIEKEITSVTRKGKKLLKSTRTVREFEFDTISTSHFYNGGNLVLTRYHDGRSYYESKYFNHDSLGNVTREQRFRETNNSPDRSYFMLGSQVLLSKDSFVYVRYSARQMKRQALNSENRPYREQIISYDSLGRQVRVSEHYTAASWITQEKTFEYANGRLASARFAGNANNNIELRTEYEYDSDGELYGEKQFRNDVLVKEISYVTEKPALLLNSFVIRDHVNKTMRIVKLRYELGLLSRTVEGKRL